MPSIVTMPDDLYRIASASFNPVYINTVSAGSSFNQSSRLDGPSSVFWKVDFSFVVSDRDTFTLYRRFVMKLRGGRVLARLYDPTMTADVQGTQPRGAGGAGPVVNVGADAVAGDEVLTISGLTISQAIALKAGDMLGIGENLHVVEDDAASDGSGLSTVALQPPLRAGVAVSDPVNLVQPTGIFRLTAGGDQLAMDLAHIGQAFTLSFIEEPDFA